MPTLSRESHIDCRWTLLFRGRAGAGEDNTEITQYPGNRNGMNGIGGSQAWKSESKNNIAPICSFARWIRRMYVTTQLILCTS